jgi:2-methylcitrate dehydratase
MPYHVQQLASFVSDAAFDSLSKPVVEAIKIRILDSLGCAIGALSNPLMHALKSHSDDFGGRALCGLIGGGKTAPDRAAFFNSALVRYLDFNDSFLAKNETCHPSDNISSILAACQYANKSGKEAILSTAVSYQVHCRLSEEAPVRRKGFDHTTQGAYAVAAGVAKALGLSKEQTAHAIAIAAVANNALRVTRTGALSHWKGLAYPNTAFSSTHAAFLAMRGVTGPMEIFEGNKGFIESIAGPFFIEWQKEPLDAVLKTIIKKYNAEIHSQSTLEAILSLRDQLPIHDIERIDLSIFDVAYNIIGGGEEGSKKEIRTKEEADHSLPYMVAVALLDGQVGPMQYDAGRIVKDDVQQLLKKVFVTPSKEFTDRFPNEMAVSITIKKKDGSFLRKEQAEYEGFFTKPMTWDQAYKKYTQLTGAVRDKNLVLQIAEMVRALENHSCNELMNLLEKVNIG